MIIRSVTSMLERVAPDSRVLLLYSGGLDGTYLLHELARAGGDGVVALTVDLGGGAPEPEELRSLCRHFGARSVVLDARDEFARDFVTPAINAHATYLNGHPISASLSRPLLAKIAVEQATVLGCGVILHTSNASQNSLRRFNGAFAALNYDGDYGAPFERSDITRPDKIAALKAAGVVAFAERAHSIDINLWCREIESADLDDPEEVPTDEAIYEWTRETAVGERTLTLEFDGGGPVSIDGHRLALPELIRVLNEAVGPYGLGRYIGLEEVASSIKVQEIREMPAAFVLLDAYRRLESAVLPAECIREKLAVEQLWVREASEGRWFGPLRTAAQQFIASLAARVSGRIVYRLARRRLQLTALVAQRPLYVRHREEYERGRR